MFDVLMWGALGCASGVLAFRRLISLLYAVDTRVESF